MNQILDENTLMTRKRSAIILDAGYVAIQSNSTVISLGLHGKKLICVITIIFMLIFVSVINLTCLIWIMYQLDWSPFHRDQGSKIFHYDRFRDQIQFHEQSRCDDGFFTTRLTNPSNSIDFTADEQIELYGNQNSILLDRHQISLNTESFYMSNRSLVQFDRLSSFQFDSSRLTRIHLNRIDSEHIHQKNLHLTANEHLTIDQINRVLFSSQNLTLNTDQHNRRSILRFQNPSMKRKSSYRRSKNTFGNIEFRSESIYLDLPQFVTFTSAPLRNDLNIYRLCLCNTTFLLLRSFSHQPCPLC